MQWVYRIVQDVGRGAEGRLGINEPLLLAQLRGHFIEPRRIAEIGSRTSAAEHALAVEPAESIEEVFAEHGAHEKLVIGSCQKRSIVREHIFMFHCDAPVMLGLLPTIQNYIQTPRRTPADFGYRSWLTLPGLADRATCACRPSTPPLSRANARGRA